MKTKKLLKIVVKTLNDKKANDIVVLKVDKKTVLSDYFIIADAKNTTHVKSLFSDIEHASKKAGFIAKRIEKDKTNNWIALDFVDLVVHIFLQSTRQFYDLEHMWADAEVISNQDILKGD